jgi:hypothetical protein
MRDKHPGGQKVAVKLIRYWSRAESNASVRRDFNERLYDEVPNARFFTPAAAQALRTSTTRCWRVLGVGVMMIG